MPIIGTDLHILFMDCDTFLDIPDDMRVVFRLFLNDSDELTLSYWSAPDTDYDTDLPRFKLKVGEKSGFKWNANMYLGDQKIGKAKVGNIKDKINSTTSANFVLFIPQPHDTFHDQVAYDINISDKIHPSLSRSLISMGLTNPSPPRNSRP